MTKPTRENFDIVLEPDYTAMKKSPAFLEYIHWQQLKERVLTINDDVDDYLIDEIILPILKWNEEDKDIPVEERKPIKVYINTYGGDVNTAVAIIETFKSSKTPIHTIVLGKAYSAGALILVAGHKRFGFKHSSILIHEGTNGVMNSASKTEDYIAFTKRVNALVKEGIVSRTNITPEKYDAMYRVEWYMFGTEAKELGVIDAFIGE